MYVVKFSNHKKIPQEIYFATSAGNIFESNKYFRILKII